MNWLSSRPRAIAVTGCLAVVAALVLSACGSSSSSTSSGSTSSSASSDGGGGESPLLVSITKLGTTGYIIDQNKGFEKEAKQLGAESRTVNVELDSEKAISEVQNAITSGAAGIAIAVPDQKIGPRVAALAEAADVPLIATDDTIETQSGEPVPFVGYDNAEMGRLVGESAAEQVNEAGWVKEGANVGVLSVEVQTLSVCQERTDEATNVVLKEVPGLEKSSIYHVPYDGSSEAALKAAPGVITAHPEVEDWVIYSCSDDGVAGALRAVEQAGAGPENIIGVGLGAYIACEEWNAGRKTGFTSALWLDGEDVGGTSAKELYQSATSGKELPKTVYAPTEMVTPATYKAAGVTC
jgi:L-arabinose transport system substrate-binding protein